MELLNMTGNNYYMMKTLLEAMGYKIVTKYKKGMKKVIFKDKDKNDKR